MNSRQPAFRGYEKGAPMGGDLRGFGEAPTFMVYALRDVIGANLDRIQIVKGWLDAKGQTHEKVYDVARSTGREPDANGVLPPVGNTVDIAAANWSNTIHRFQGARDSLRARADQTKTGKRRKPRPS